MPSSTTAFSSCRLSAMPHRTGSKHISILLGRVYPNCREYRKSSSFYQETHKDRRLLPNPALSGRCIEDFYPLVYFLGLCKGVSLSALQKHVWETPASKKCTSLPLRKERCSKITLFGYYLHDYYKLIQYRSKKNTTTGEIKGNNLYIITKHAQHLLRYAQYC